MPGAPAPDFGELGARLREYGVTDAEFDRVFPTRAREVSSEYWTPVAVAQRAASLLVQKGCRRVLDVGSGVGKFCIVGAAFTGATFVGVEHRGHFVATARDAARRIGVGSAQFVHGTFDAVNVADFDALYFFNPFEENLWTQDVQLDQTVHLSEGRFSADVDRARHMLAHARIGTWVMTYHGLGDDVPAGYVLSHREPHRSGYLKLWVKASPVTRRPLGFRLLDFLDRDA